MTRFDFIGEGVTSYVITDPHGLGTGSVKKDSKLGRTIARAMSVGWDDDELRAWLRAGGFRSVEDEGPIDMVVGFFRDARDLWRLRSHLG